MEFGLYPSSGVKLPACINVFQVRLRRVIIQVLHPGHCSTLSRAVFSDVVTLALHALLGTLQVNNSPSNRFHGALEA